MKFSLLISILCLLTGCMSPNSERDGEKAEDPLEQFRGRWRLYRIERLADNGEWQVNPRFAGRQGYILYDGLGGMGVHHVPAGYQSYDMESGIPVDSLSRDDLEHIAGQFIYFGRYSLDTASKTITHHIETDQRPSWWGRDAKRTYAFHGDTLQLMPVTADSKARIVWIKVTDR